MNEILYQTKFIEYNGYITVIEDEKEKWFKLKDLKKILSTHSHDFYISKPTSIEGLKELSLRTTSENLKEALNDLLKFLEKDLKIKKNLSLNIVFCKKLILILIKKN